MATAVDSVAAVRSLIILVAMLSPSLACSQAASANETSNPVHQSASTALPKIRISPDLLRALTANTRNTIGRVVDEADMPEGHELLLAAGPLQTDPSEPADVAGYCASLAGAGEHSVALATVCEFALSVPKKLPDVICERTTKRYWKTPGGETLFEKASKPDLDDVTHSDVITSEVTYRDGQEYYSNIRVDGQPADTAAPWSSGAWSVGEFILSLNTIFFPSSKPEFRYRKQEKLHGAHALVFDFHVSAENNKIYYLRSSGMEWLPEYSGRLWLDKTDFRLLRLERETADMPTEPITRMKTETNYSLVALGDGTSIVVPVHSDVLICVRQSGPFSSCARNIVTFTEWHKFRATTNIILDPK